MESHFEREDHRHLAIRYYPIVDKTAADYEAEGAGGGTPTTLQNPGLNLHHDAIPPAFKKVNKISGRNNTP